MALARDSALDLRLRNDLYCVEWGVKLYSLTQHWILTRGTGRTSVLAPFGINRPGGCVPEQ